MWTNKEAIINLKYLNLVPMKYFDNKENCIPLHNLHGVQKKHIRKIPRSKRCVLKAVSGTSNFEENINCETTPSASIPSPKVEPNVISPLKELLEDLPVKLSAKKPPAVCEFITLKTEKKGETERFKLFKESEVPLFTQVVTKVEMNDLGYDNDCQTDNEQINAAIESTQSGIIEALSNNREGKVRNIKRFLCERAILSKKHRIY